MGKNKKDLKSLSKKIHKYLKDWEGARIGLLTNQTGYSWELGYHFQYLNSLGVLKRVFLPEHGLFAELQDQVSGANLSYFLPDCEFWNLYGDTEDTLVPPIEKIKDLDLIIISIRDVGARYYTFLTTAYYILIAISKWKKAGMKVPSVMVWDSTNPIGKKVEGTPLKPEYESFVGVQGVLHRHGLTPGELLVYYNNRDNLNLKIHVVPPGIFHPKKYDPFLWIPPSPNIPSQTTCYVYTGQCLLEGTNLSEGRGTTRPFEIFGAPFIDPDNDYLKEEIEKVMKGTVYLRPLRFQPTFHKYANKICGGYQIHIININKFHSLFFSIHLLRMIGILYHGYFEYLTGVYEFRSDRPAIELLLGDPILLDYINGGLSIKIVQEYIHEEEEKWKKNIKSLF